MKRTSTYLFLMVIQQIVCCTVFAQSNAFIDSILNNRIVKIPVYEQPIINNKSMLRS